jgi:chorismate--pyruvate lyase
MTGTPFHWNLTPPRGYGTVTTDCLTEPESLTDRLIASGRRFAVDVLFLGPDAAAEGEAEQVGIPPDGQVFARHVALTLDGMTVVVARSYCRLGCPVWTPILDRGSRSLGFTLFSGEVPTRRGPLQFRLTKAGDVLFTLARQRDSASDSYPARRCRFELDGAGMVVCEVFLPSLETLARRAA